MLPIESSTKTSASTSTKDHDYIPLLCFDYALYKSIGYESQYLLIVERSRDIPIFKH